MGAGATATSAMYFGGAEIPAGLTESYNGTSWTEVADMALNYGSGAGSPAGSNVLALKCGGPNPSPANTATEEWTVPEANKTLASTNA